MEHRLDAEHTVILACSSLREHVEETQKKLGIQYPVIYLNKLYHRDPEEMREHILEELGRLGENIDTVLVAMGYCGGSWEQVRVPCRLVMPGVDDCVSLLLQRGDEPVFDLKEAGHLYVRDKDPEALSFRKIFERMTEGIDPETKEKYHEDWKGYYHQIDIIDTGLFDVRSQDYTEVVRRDAEWLEAGLGFREGGTHLLEKLLSGKWDDQFVILEPEGEMTKEIIDPASFAES